MHNFISAKFNIKRWYIGIHIRHDYCYVSSSESWEVALFNYFSCDTSVPKQSSSLTQKEKRSSIWLCFQGRKGSSSRGCDKVYTVKTPVLLHHTSTVIAQKALMFTWLTGTIVPFMHLYKAVTHCSLQCKTSRSFIPLDKAACFPISPCLQLSAPFALARRGVLVKDQAVLVTFPVHVKKFESMPLTFRQGSTELSTAVEILNKFFVRWIPFAEDVDG